MTSTRNFKALRAKHNSIRHEHQDIYERNTTYTKGHIIKNELNDFIIQSLFTTVT